MKHQLIFARNQISNLYAYTLFNQINVNANVEVLFHATLLTKILTIRKFQKNFFSKYSSLTLLCFSNSTTVPTHQEGGSPIPQMSILQHTISSRLRLMTFCHQPSLHWYWHPQYPIQFAKCKHQPSSRWRNPPQSQSL